MSKHRPPSIERLRHYKRMPPPFKGDPPRQWKNWGERCAAIYGRMMAEKRGEAIPVPKRDQRGLWFHAA